MIRKTLILRVMVSAWLLLSVTEGRVIGQVAKLDDPQARKSMVVRIGIRDFRKVYGISRLDILEQTLPQVLRAGLYFQEWLDVSLLGKTALASENAATTKAGGLEGGSTSKENVDLVVDGEIVEVSQEHIRVDIMVTDVLRRTVIYRDSVELDSQQMGSVMGQAADRLASFLQAKVLNANLSGRMVAVIGPFDNKAADQKLSFLNSSLPLTVSGTARRPAELKNLVVRPIVPGVGDQTSSDWDICVTGSIAAEDGSIVISAIYTERSGLKIPIEHTGTASEPLKTIDGFSRKVWEVIAGRIAPQGGFRNEPVLAGNPSADKLFARGQEYEKSGDIDGALFMYGMALRKKSDHLAARLGMAAVYRKKEEYELAEAQYEKVLEQSNLNAVAHFGLGMVYSKLENYGQAAKELEQAATLAPHDRQLQFDAYMQLGDVYLLMKQPDADKSIQCYLRAREINNSSPAPYLALGRASHAKNDFEGAVAHLKKGLALWPTDESLKNGLASALIDFGKQKLDDKAPAAALDAFQEVIELDPPDASLKALAYCDAGIVQVWNFGQAQKGIPLLETATELDPRAELGFRALGVAYRKFGKYKEAIQALKKAIALSPQFDSYWELAYTYYSCQDYDFGIEMAQKMVQTDPQNANGYLMLGALYKSKYDKSHNDKESQDLATANLKQAIKLDAKNGEPHRLLGLLFHEEEMNEEAVAELKQAINIQPTALCYASLGEIYEGLHKTDEAVAAFLEGLKLDRRYEWIYDELDNNNICSAEKSIEILKDTIKADPTYVDAYIRLARKVQQQGRLEEALEWLDKAIAIDNNNEWAYRVMGFTYSSMGELDRSNQEQSKREYETAISYLNKANQVEETEWSYEKLGEVYAALGEGEKAINNLQKAIEINPKSEYAYGAAEKVYDQLGKGEEFNRLLSGALAKDPAFYWGRTELAKRYVAGGKYDEAVEQAAKAVEIDPQRAESYEFAEEIYDKSERGQEFNDLLKESIAKDPKFSWGQIELARRYNSAGKYKDAIEQASRALELEPENVNPYLELARAQLGTSDFKAAYENGHKALELNPQDDNAIWYVTNALFGQKQYTKAIGELDKQLCGGAIAEFMKLPRFTSSPPLIMALLANAYRQNGTLAKAHFYAQKAMALTPKWLFVQLYSHWVDGQTFFDEKKYPETIAAAKELLKLDPEYGNALALLHNASHQIGQDQEALQLLKQLELEHPKSLAIIAAIGYVTHEYPDVMDYEASYEAFQKAYEMDPKNWGVVQNFAEACLTVGRLDEVLEFAPQVLASSDASPQSRLSMKFLQIAAYLLKGAPGRALAELGIFRDEYKNVPNDYERGWVYEGTKYYIKANSKLNPGEKTLLLQMLALLEASQDKANVELKKFEDSFEKTFAELKSSGSVSK